MSADCIRVICISDTHNFGGQIALPRGDVLIHAGDLLTQSGLRYLRDGEVSPAGVSAVKEVCEWLGSLPYKEKIVVPGNHDGAFEGVGAEFVQRHLESASADSGTSTHYLVERAVRLPLSGLVVAGSPYAQWGSENKAFFENPAAGGPERPHPSTWCPAEVDVVVTHFPACWTATARSPSRRPRTLHVKDVEHDRSTASRLMSLCGPLVHVAGHLHWAYGVFELSLRHGKTLFAVAASAGSWHGDMSTYLSGKGADAGDGAVHTTGRTDVQGDLSNGGYDNEHGAIIIDIPKHLRRTKQD